MKKYAILLDDTYCTGCNSCAYRCIQEFRYHDQAAKGLFRTFVQINDDGLYHKRCMHCVAPDCVANCPMKAWTKSEYGPVLYNAKLCVGCQTCVNKCKFHVPQYDADTKKIVKCSMCAHRTSEGKMPACVEVCSTGALQFGEYNEILERAKTLAARNNLKIYGMKENGGTHFFILSKNEAVQFGYPEVPVKDIKNAATGNNITMPVMAAMAVGGFKKFSDRRTLIEAEEKESKE